MKTETAPTVVKTDEEWRKQLTPEQYYVTRQHGTERAFTGPYWNEKQAGKYDCVCCDAPLFSSETKFELGDRLAELLEAGHARCRERARRSVVVHTTHGSALRTLRCPSRARFPGRTKADRAALLHERHCAQIRAKRDLSSQLALSRWARSASTDANRMVPCGRSAVIEPSV